MCLASAYLVGGGGKPFLEEATFVEFNGDQIRMVSFSGEKKVITGRLVEVDLFAETVLVEQSDGPAAPSFDARAANPPTG